MAALFPNYVDRHWLPSWVPNLKCVDVAVMVDASLIMVLDDHLVSSPFRHSVARDCRHKCYDKCPPHLLGCSTGMAVQLMALRKAIISWRGNHILIRKQQTLLWTKSKLLLLAVLFSPSLVLRPSVSPGSLSMGDSDQEGPFVNHSA